MNRTVTYAEDLEPQLREAYPAATSVPEALVMAAQDGVYLRTTQYTLLSEDEIRDIVQDELEN